MMNEATYGTDNAAGRNSVLWDEEGRVVEACAASKLYRKRRRAWLIAFPPALNDMIRENRSVRVEEMLRQLFPGLKSRSRNDHENIASDNSIFQEFIYNPFRNGPISRHRLSCDLSQGQEAFPVEVYSDTENYDPPVEFTYISKNDYSNYRGRCSFQDTEGIAMVRCDCRNMVCFVNCSCRQMNDLLNPCTLLGDGRVIINTDATFHNTLIVGCGERCACMAQCKNTLRSKCLPAPFKFEVFRRSDKLGFGLRTLSNIPYGCAVVEFCGEVLNAKDMGLRGSRSLDYSFCLHQAEETQIYEKLAFARQMQHDAFDKWNEMVYIDQYRKGNIARFISHGCFPNLTVLRYAENDLRLHRSHAILFANQPIVGGSELFFDYGEDYLSRNGFACECNTMWCNNVVKRGRSRYSTYRKMTNTSNAYFDRMEQRMVELEAKARQYLRDKGIVKPEYDDLDSADACNVYDKSLRPDPSSVHKRDGDEAPTICYNLYCQDHSTCTCEPLRNFIPVYTLDD